MRKLLIAITTTLFFAISATGLTAATSHKKAPEWVISKWINSPGLTVEELKGKVIVVDFFQLWCPGCNSFSIPLMNHWEILFQKEVAENGNGIDKDGLSVD